MPKRIYSLDVLRGVPIAIMLFLDAPPDKIFSLRHVAKKIFPSLKRAAGFFST